MGTDPVPEMLCIKFRYIRWKKFIKLMCSATPQVHITKLVVPHMYMKFKFWHFSDILLHYNLVLNVYSVIAYTFLFILVATSFDR